MNDVLTLENLHHTFEKGTINENHVLKGINLSLDPGDFVTIIGGNGAGKSTLLNSIAGTFSVDQGQILLNGKNITKKSVVERSKSISRVFQDPKLGTAVRLTVEENLALAMKRGKKTRLLPWCQTTRPNIFQRPAGSAKFGVGKSFILRNRFAVWRTTSSYYVIDGHITASRTDLIR